MLQHECHHGFVMRGTGDMSTGRMSGTSVLVTHHDGLRTNVNSVQARCGRQSIDDGLFPGMQIKKPRSEFVCIELHGSKFDEECPMA